MQPMFSTQPARPSCSTQDMRKGLSGPDQLKEEELKIVNDTRAPQEQRLEKSPKRLSSKLT